MRGDLRRVVSRVAPEIALGTSEVPSGIVAVLSPSDRCPLYNAIVLNKFHDELLRHGSVNALDRLAINLIAFGNLCYV
jgi:hypothetical protein